MGALSESCTRDELEQEFRQFGAITSVSVIEADYRRIKRQPYAFIQFDSSKSAQSAIESHATLKNDFSGVSTPLYQHVRTAEPIDSTKRKRSNASRQSQQAEFEEMKIICSKTNLVLQVQSSHLDRVKDYLTLYLPSIIHASGTLSPEEMFHSLEIQGFISAVTKNMSLLFISVSNPALFVEELGKSRHHQVVVRAVKKIYVVQQGAVEADLNDDYGCQVVVQDLIQNKLGKILDGNFNNGVGQSFKIYVFPPSRQSKVLTTIEDMDDGSLAAKLNPCVATDVISIVQVHEYKGRNNERESHSLVMSGVSKALQQDNSHCSAMDDGNEAISRAYFKLIEALERYSVDHPNFSTSSFAGSVAIDCGSAPGGWTKYLAQDLQCELVHSVDPGSLDVKMENINHMQMKIQDAFPILKQQIGDSGKKIKLFVSDACLHSMEGQVDFLLEAKEQGITENEVFFVLTLKCTTGHGRATFDEKVNEVVMSLNNRAKTRDFSVYHLFSNRSGERTIIGTLL